MKRDFLNLTSLIQFDYNFNYRSKYNELSAGKILLSYLEKDASKLLKLHKCSTHFGLGMKEHSKKEEE